MLRRSDDTGALRRLIQLLGKHPAGSALENAWRRLNEDFQLAVATLLGGITLLGITPFAVLRAVDGQWLALATDITVEVGILGAVLQAWRSGDARHPSLFLSYFLGVMATVTVFVLGIPGRYWFFPAIVANFFLVDRRHALTISIVALSAIALGGGLPQRPDEAASFVVTVIVSTMLSYVFAYRVGVQRTQLELLATRDTLTGIFNRHTLLTELERAHSNFGQEGQSFGMLVLDLDHFKNINDRHGHLAGDQMLVAVAKRLGQNIREGDILFRYGGEEFVVLARHATREGLTAMAEKLRSVIEQGIRDPDGRVVTLSIGGAMLRAGETVDEWFSRADAGLYEAKNGGRNRVVVTPDADGDGGEIPAEIPATT